MKKYMFIFSLVLLLMLPTTSLAHTHLTDSNPQDGQVVEESLQEIQFFFDSSIENLSTFEISNDQGDVLPVEITIEHDTMIGTFAAPLPDGTYAVTWDIIGEDGHLINGEFSFEVTGQDQVVEEDIAEEDSAIDTTEEPAENDNEVIEDNISDDVQNETEEIDIEEPLDNEPGQVEQELSETESSKTDSDFPIATVSFFVALFVIVLVGIWWFFRRN